MPPKYLTKSAIKSMIKEGVQEEAEKKTYYSLDDETLCRVATAAEVPTTIPLACRPSKGTGRSNRLGDEVTAISGKVDIYFTMRKRDDTANVKIPQRVRVLVVSQKDNVEDPVEAGTNPSAAELDQLFWEGATNGSYAGNITDMIRNINRQKWTVHEDFQFTLGYQVTYDPASGIVPEDHQMYGSTFESTKRVTIKAPRAALGHLEYGVEGAANQPNRKAWILVQHVPVDGSDATAGLGGSAIVHTSSTMFRYTDM